MVAAIAPSDIRRRPNGTLLAASASMLAIAMSITASGVALGHVEVGDNIGITHLQWVMNGFILSFAACLLPFGSIVDRIGARKVFLSGCAIFALATVVTVCAGSFLILMSGRLLQGIGAAQLAAAGPAALAALLDNDAQRKRAFGYLGASGGIGLTLGAFLSGVVSNEGGWRIAFALHLPFVIAAGVFAFGGIRDRAKAPLRSFDLLGTALSVVCIASGMVFAISGSSLGWTSPWVLGTSFTAALTGAAFVAVEARAPVPLLRLSLLRNRQFALASMVCVLFTTVWVALFIYVPLNLAAGYARSGAEVGATMLALMIPALIMPVLASRWARHARVEIVLACGFVLMAAGLALLFVGWRMKDLRAFEIVGLIVCGAGAGTLYGLADYYALSAVPPEQAGVASGSFNLLRLAGDALGTIVPAAVLLAELREGLGHFQSMDVPRAVVNELAAGRFDAVRSLRVPEPLMPLVRSAVVDSFKEGMTRVVVALGVFAFAGIALLVPPLLKSQGRR